MNIASNYPKIIKMLEDKNPSIRHLLVIDENYGDVDSDEFDVFDPSEYNYMVYMTERLQAVLGEKKLPIVIDILQKSDAYQDFYAHENDIYGVMTTLDEEGIAENILNVIENTLS